MNSREAFEQWASMSLPCCAFERDRDGDYIDVDSYDTWMAWQAACQYKDEQYAPMIETASLQAVKLGRAQSLIDKQRGVEAKLQGEINHMEARIAELEAQRVPDVDALAQLIRKVDGSNSKGAGELADDICTWLPSAPPAPTGDSDE